MGDFDPRAPHGDGEPRVVRDDRVPRVPCAHRDDGDHLDLGIHTGNTYTERESTVPPHGYCGHRRRPTELVGYHFPEHESGPAPQHELLKKAPGKSYTLLPLSNYPVGQVAASNVAPCSFRQDECPGQGNENYDSHENYANYEYYRNRPSADLPRAYSPISSLQLLGMTGTLPPGERHSDTMSSRAPSFSADSSLVSPHLLHPQPAGPTFKKRVRVACRNGRVCIARFFSLDLPNKTVQKTIWGAMGVSIFSITVSSIVYNTNPLHLVERTAVVIWIGASVGVLVILLIYNNSRYSKLSEFGGGPGCQGYWVELAELVDRLPAPSRVHLHDDGVIYRSHAGGKLPSLSHNVIRYADPKQNEPKSQPESESKLSKAVSRTLSRTLSKTFSLSLPKSKSKPEPKAKTTTATESGSTDIVKPIRYGCVVPVTSGPSGPSGPSVEELQPSARSPSPQFSDSAIGVARSDSLRREEDLVKAMKDRHTVLQHQRTPLAATPEVDVFAVGSDSDDSIEVPAPAPAPAVTQGRGLLPDFRFPNPYRPGNRTEPQFGTGLPPRDTWCREPHGSFANLRQDDYGDDDDAKSSAGPSGMANGGVIPARSSSLATARFRELTPITERSSEFLSSPRDIVSSPRTVIQSPPGEMLPSSPPAAHIPSSPSRLF
ncbi:hypothetical protein F4781DRAFT_356938 [Annulohypoxylon bovei var. microspora]|nr:hypothetical protein F4781DRAFT_356938 [Annulohypoxylon bovei var. microspora]